MSAAPTTPPLDALYEADETAWLEAHAALITAGRFGELDYAHLAEYLTDMAKRDKREVFSRLVVLLTHLLKWEHQPDRRGPSWAVTILEQRRELQFDMESGVLRNHAADRFADAYARARRQAAVETELPPATFPADCRLTLDEALADDEPA